MPRCCVPTCDSGTSKDIKRTVDAGLRITSFFKFPKDKNLHKKWKQIIFNNAEQELNNKNPKICQLHFDDSDIIKYDETTLKDGTIHKIQRHRYLLRNGAIPNPPTSQKISIKSSFYVERPKIERLEDFPMSSTFIKPLVQYQKKTLNDIQSNEETRKFKGTYQSNPIDASKDASKVIDTSSMEEKSEKLQNDKTEIDPEIMILDLQKQPTEETEDNFLSITSVPNVDYNISEQKINNQVKIQRNNIIPCELYMSETENDKEKVIKKAISSKLIYNFIQLKRDLEHKTLNISSSWAYMFQGNTSVTFVYVHPLKFVIQLLCIVDYDLNVKISTADKRITSNMNVNIRSGTDLINFLSSLEKKKVCEGTGIKHKYSTKCQGFISSNQEYQRSRGYQRCNFCREFRKIILKKEDNPLDIELRIREQNRKIKALQFKYKQLQKLLIQKYEKIEIHNSVFEILNEE